MPREKQHYCDVCGEFSLCLQKVVFDYKPHWWMCDICKSLYFNEDTENFNNLLHWVKRDRIKNIIKELSYLIRDREDKKRMLDEANSGKHRYKAIKEKIDRDMYGEDEEGKEYYIGIDLKKPRVKWKLDHREDCPCGWKRIE